MIVGGVHLPFCSSLSMRLGVPIPKWTTCDSRKDSCSDIWKKRYLFQVTWPYFHSKDRNVRERIIVSRGECCFHETHRFLPPSPAQHKWKSLKDKSNITFMCLANNLTVLQFPLNSAADLYTKKILTLHVTLYCSYSLLSSESDGNENVA